MKLENLKMAAIIFILIMMILGSNNADADVVSDYREADKLWKVTRENSPPSYFFGTVHEPVNLVWDSISNEAKEAFKNSDAVYSEFNIDYETYKDDEDKYSMLENGVKIKDAKSVELYAKLLYIFYHPTDNQNLLRIRNHHWMEHWYKLKPSFLFGRIMILEGGAAFQEEWLPQVDERQPSSSENKILDLYLKTKAIDSGKIFDGVESFKNHFYEFIHMPDHLAEYMLEMVLGDLGFKFERNRKLDAEVSQYIII